MTTTFNKELWEKIINFQIDEPNAYEPFSKRLAREQKWTTEFTQKAIEEYKKFMYLAVTCNFSVTPSIVIDEVWHTHLIYTKSYWNSFCKEVLGKEIHHTPSGGSDAEKLLYHDAFLKTKEAYELVFREKPPSEVWDSDPKATKDNRENDISLIPGFLISGFATVSGFMFNSLFVFFGALVAGIILSSFMYPTTTSSTSDAGSCGSAGCGGGCGGCGGCGGG